MEAAAASSGRQGIFHPRGLCLSAQSRYRRDDPPERVDQQANRRRRGSAGGRPPVFDPVVHRRRKVVERCFNRLEQYRAIAARYDKTATSYCGMLNLATPLIWL